MVSPEARPSQAPINTEQEAWRNERMYGANAFIAALEIAEAVGSISEPLKIGALNLFISSVFESRVTDVEGEKGLFRVDIKRPDGKVRRALIRSGGEGGLSFDARFSDVLPDGSEIDVKEREGLSFFHLAQRIAY